MCGTQSYVIEKIVDIRVQFFTQYAICFCFALQLSECDKVPTSPEQSYKLKPWPPVTISKAGIEEIDNTDDDALLSPSNTTQHLPQSLLHDILGKIDRFSLTTYE